MRYLFNSEILNERKSIYARQIGLRAMFAGIIVIPLERMHHLTPGQMSIMHAATDMLSGHNNNYTHLNRT